MPNHLAGETSPYLLQHADNPVDWYPWGAMAFDKARREDKPVFLSIGYSTCHWCHVMARESFEDEGVAALLNESFVPVKVDREERPDVDSVYMEVCAAVNGSGGWPLTVLLTPEGKPFFAGTYLPRESRGGRLGLLELLETVRSRWAGDRRSLTDSAEKVTEALRRRSREAPGGKGGDEQLLEGALWLYLHSFDEAWGGFGDAPKFPAPHNLLFLLQQYHKRGDGRLLAMVEKTLAAMLTGGIFDQIGWGFCRYATDRAWLVPHFEKMLYDNALLLLALARTYGLTGKEVWLRAAERTADWMLRELRLPGGAFAAAQDADSLGEEGAYYLFTPREVEALLGPEEGSAFCWDFGITEEGNFHGRSIPNRLGRDPADSRWDALLPRLREYRRRRCPLSLDDKVLLGWNSLAVIALCALGRVSRKEAYLTAARETMAFLEEKLCRDGQLFAGFRAGKTGAGAFLDDCAAFLCARLAIYEAGLEEGTLRKAAALADRIREDFLDEEEGGFFLTSRASERLILRTKESRDGALPSGNSLMALGLTRLNALLPDPAREDLARRHLDWMARRARLDPTGHAAFLMALSDALDPPARVTVSAAGPEALMSLPFDVPWEVPLRAVCPPTEEYPLLRGNTAFYVCREDRCLPPENELRPEALAPRKP